VPKVSAGILLYRVKEGRFEVLLVHPGGPYFAKKDLQVWSIPKGEVNHGEDLLEAARREMQEETGIQVNGPFIQLTPIIQRSGKVVYAWACEGDCDPKTIKSNVTRVEWPPRSGKYIEVPEVDRAEWMTLEQARQRINPAQVSLLEELHDKLTAEGRLHKT
jgi:predicted NUDIX family NTP pyrophosphohydrolase